MTKFPVLEIFVSFLYVSCATAQLSFEGKCLDIPVVQPFDLAGYLGVWYEVQKYPAIFEADGKCVYAVYSANDNGTIRVRNARIVPESNEYSEVVGYARQVEPEAQNGKLVVKFPQSPEGAYWVLGTDYARFSVVWSCTQVEENRNLQFLWFLARDRFPSAETRIYVRNFMQRLGLDTSVLVPTDQASCPDPLSIT